MAWILSVNCFWCVYAGFGASQVVVCSISIVVYHGEAKFYELSVSTSSMDLLEPLRNLEWGRGVLWIHWCALGLGCLERYTKPRQMIQPEKTVLLLLNRPTDFPFCKHTRTDRDISSSFFLTYFFFPLGMEIQDLLERSELNFTGLELAVVHAEDVCVVNS